MSKLNSVVVNLLACLANPNIKQAILKNNTFKVTPLKNLKQYTDSQDFKSKTVDDSNYDKCLAYALKNLNDETVLNYVHSKDICHIVFYPNEKRAKNALDVKSAESNVTLDSLKRIITSYEVRDNVLMVFVHPVKTYKDTILSNKEAILNHFKSLNHAVDDINVQFQFKDAKLDDIAESLLDSGFCVS